MNEFVAKKLGEVLAFTRVGQQLMERGGAALVEALGEEIVKNLEADLGAQRENIEKLANEITQQKAGATGEKLVGMAETYIGDQWDNPAELLEWLGFFGGAALVHWQLVKGAGEVEAELVELADSGINLHRQLLAEVGEAIAKIGRQRAQ